MSLRTKESVVEGLPEVRSKANLTLAILIAVMSGMLLLGGVAAGEADVVDETSSLFKALQNKERVALFRTVLDGSILVLIPKDTLLDERVQFISRSVIHAAESCGARQSAATGAPDNIIILSPMAAPTPSAISTEVQAVIADLGIAGKVVASDLSDQLLGGLSRDGISISQLEIGHQTVVLSYLDTSALEDVPLAHAYDYLVLQSMAGLSLSTSQNEEGNFQNYMLASGDVRGVARKSETDHYGAVCRTLPLIKLICEGGYEGKESLVRQKMQELDATCNAFAKQFAN